MIELLIDDIKDGACFFEGYIPSIDKDDLNGKLLQLMGESIRHTFIFSVWSDDSTEAEWEQEYPLSKYIDYFNTKKILILHYSYEKIIQGISFNIKLMFEDLSESRTCEIICYSEPILESNNPPEAIKIAIGELRHLRSVFEGDSLFIGHATLNYPKTKDDDLREWLRIE